MTQQRILNFLGLAKRARKIVTGQELVLKAVKNGQVYFVFLATDTGAVAQKSFQTTLKKRQIPFDQTFSQIQLSQAIGQATKAIAITDRGFAQRFQELITNN